MRATISALSLLVVPPHPALSPSKLRGAIAHAAHRAPASFIPTNRFPVAEIHPAARLRAVPGYRCAMSTASPPPRGFAQVFNRRRVIATLALALLWGLILSPTWKTG